MQKYLLITILFCTLFKIGNAQNSEVRAQSVFGEFGGNGLVFSANYDTRFQNKQSGIGGRLGIGFFGGTGGGVLTFPIWINYLSGKKGNYLETGLGVTIVTITGEDFGGVTGSVIVPSIGYRFQPLESGFTGRIVISPLIGTEGGFVFFAGIS